VLATVLLPITLVFLILLANDRELMGRWVNRPAVNRLAIAIVAFVSVCGTAYGIDSFLQTVHLI
jgi:Mn2+/Fe2+ NRAMP family transporter